MRVRDISARSAAGGLVFESQVARALVKIGLGRIQLTQNDLAAAAHL